MSSIEGHTGNREDMKKLHMRIDSSAEEELLKLKEKTDERRIIGFSMAA